MEIEPRAEDAGTDRDGKGEALFSIPDLLNILYRGRRLIVLVTGLGLLAGLGYAFLTKPLYRATGQIRPGIVSYTPDGGPIREWALKDITTWFEESLYWTDMRDDPVFDRLKGAPVIKAEFIPSSLVTAGGDVITLQTLSPDSALARKILGAAVTSFKVQAELDSLGSSLYLTLKGGQIRMARALQEIEKVDAAAQRAVLEIEKQKREMTLLEIKRREMEINAQGLEVDNVWRRDAIQVTGEQVADAARRLAQAEELLKAAVGTETAAGAGSPLVGSADPRLDLLLQTAGREQAGRVGELLLTINELSAVIHEGRIMADSLQARISSNELEISRFGLYRDILIKKEMGDIEQKIADLQIQLDTEIPFERAKLLSEYNSESVKMNIVSPLQTLGRITVSDKPVRPRKLLATALLTVLGLFGSICLVFVLEYYQKNRRVIARKSRA